MRRSFDSMFGGSPRKYAANKVAVSPVAPRSSRPDPLIANLHFPDKFYIVAAFCDYPPPEGVNPISEDTALLLYALHEQATKGPCRVPRPWSLFETQDQLNWDAWKALEGMPAIEAMALYCRTVEEDNPNWWNVLTEHLDDAEKREVLETAAKCAEEYRAFVAAGKLVAPRAAAAAGDFTSASSSSTERRDGLPFLARGPPRAPDPPSGLSSLFDPSVSARLVDLFSANRPVKPWSRGKLSINQPSMLPRDPAETESAAGMRARVKNKQNDKAEAAVDALASGAELTALDERVKRMVRWTTLETTGRAPAARYQHACWTRGEREMWVAHGSFNGRALDGVPHVLDLKTLEWSAFASATEENGERTARVSGAAAVVAPNDAAYVFGGSTRRNETGAAAAAAADEKDAASEVASVRCLDLAELDDSLTSGHRKKSASRSKRTARWIDASAERTPETGPCPRAHHTATLVGGEVYVFGGTRLGPGGSALDRENLWGGEEETLGDLWAYDGAEGSWRRCLGRGPPGGVVGSKGGGGSGEKGGSSSWDPEPTEAPSPRAGHVACAADDRFLLVFGGAAGHALADADVHAYDTWSHRWVKPRAVTGKPPRARSGHAACAVGTHWYVCGGGDNAEARPETHRLEMHDAASGEYHWSVLDPGGDPGDPRGRGDVGAGFEGMSLAPFRGVTGDFIVAFGGSDGKCVDATRAMRVSDWGAGEEEDASLDNDAVV